MQVFCGIELGNSCIIADEIVPTELSSCLPRSNRGRQEGSIGSISTMLEFRERKLVVLGPSDRGRDCVAVG